MASRVVHTWRCEVGHELSIEAGPEPTGLAAKRELDEKWKSLTVGCNANVAGKPCRKSMRYVLPGGVAAR